MSSPLPCLRRIEPSAALIPHSGQRTLAYVPAEQSDIRKRIHEFNRSIAARLEKSAGKSVAEALPENLEVVHVKTQPRRMLPQEERAEIDALSRFIGPAFRAAMSRSALKNDDGATLPLVDAGALRTRGSFASASLID